MSFVDELVLLGNHRDAWVFGAADASSGTAAMMELSRVLGKQLEKGTSQLKAESCTSLLKWGKKSSFISLCPGEPWSVAENLHSSYYVADTEEIGFADLTD